MAAADGKDAASGALGGVVGEVAAQAFLANKLKTGISKDDLPALEERGVNYAKLAAGLVAAIAGADIGTASMTADNAVRNNVWETAWDGLCVLYDLDKIRYGYYKDDKGLMKEGFIDLAFDSTAFFIPFVPAGLSKLARNADKAAETASKIGKEIASASGKEVKVIGRLEDTAAAKGWKDHDVLDIPNWNMQKNMEWVDSGIAKGQDFYTASRESGNLIQTTGKYNGTPTVYAQEIDRLVAAGYKKVGDYYVHPENLGQYLSRNGKK